ncbi:MAG: hypothetical protein V3V08_05665 [Nannocystaceae bacterium]
MKVSGALFVTIMLVGGGWLDGVPWKLLFLAWGAALFGYLAGWFDAWGWLQSELGPPE